MRNLSCTFLIGFTLCASSLAAETTTAKAENVTPQAATPNSSNVTTVDTPSAIQAQSYAELLQAITPESSVEEFKALWKAYLNSESFAEANTSETIPYTASILDTDTKEGCTQQLPELQAQLTTHFPNLALHYAALRCYSLLENSIEADKHEAYFTKLSSVMTLTGNGEDSDHPIWAASTIEAISFLEISGYDTIGEIFSYNTKHEKFLYVVQAIDEKLETKIFIFDAADIIDNLIRVHAHKATNGKALTQKVWSNALGTLQSMLWLSSQGEAAATVYLGDINANREKDLSRQAALLYYQSAAELGSTVGANRYAKAVLKHQQEDLYESAADYLSDAVAMRDCYSAVTLIQMYELSLGVQRDQDIIDGLIDLCAPKDNYNDLIYEIADAFYNGDGARRNHELAVAYWQRAADAGHDDSLFALAHRTINGQGREKDLAAGIKMLKTLADNHHGDGLTSLGYYLDEYPEFQETYGSPIPPSLEAAALGEHWAQSNLGYFYGTGRWVEKDEAQSLQWYQQAADQDNARAAYWSGIYYLKGEAVPADYDKARHYLQIAADHNDSAAWNALGVMAERGLGQDADLKQAREHYSRAANANNRLAAANLYTSGFRHSGPYLNDQDIVKHIEKLAEPHDDPEAMTAMSIFALYGYSGVERSSKVARRWLKRAHKHDYPPAFYLFSDGNVNNFITYGFRAPSSDRDNLTFAANHGVTAAAFTMGEFYYKRGHDDHDDEDWREALKFFQQAAQGGHVRAMFRAGDIYEKGLGVPVNIEQAVGWYEKAAEENFAVALNTLATLYMQGTVVPQQPAKAIRYFEQAADQGLVLSKRNLGRVYSQGRYVPRDLSKAVEWYMQASDDGDAPSIVHLGELLLLEPELGPSYELARIYFYAATRKGNDEALFWLARSYELEQTEEITAADVYDLYSTAAKVGNAWAKNNMGVMHLTGEAPDADEDDAADLFEEAHEAGNHSATANLAWCYEHGLGVRQRPEKAMQLYQQAANAGSPFALARLAQLAEDPQSETYNLTAALGYRELLTNAMQNRVVYTAARSLIPLPESDATAQSNAGSEDSGTTQTPSITAITTQ